MPQLDNITIHLDFAIALIGTGIIFGFVAGYFIGTYLPKKESK